MQDALTHAVTRCPFLRELAARGGGEYAQQIASNPFVPVGHPRRRPVLEEADSLADTFSLFHGPGGVVPLAPRGRGQQGAAEEQRAPRCPMMARGCSPQQHQHQHQQPLPPATSGMQQRPQEQQQQRHAAVKGVPPLPARSPLAHAPLASMSLSFGSHMVGGGAAVLLRCAQLWHATWPSCDVAFLRALAVVQNFETRIPRSLAPPTPRSPTSASSSPALSSSSRPPGS